MSTIKTSFPKIEFHPLFYFFLFLAACSGAFRKMILFTSLILIHELGHAITAYFFHWKVDKIMIYPYGGCSYFDVEVNCSTIEEILILIMGPLVQVIFTCVCTFFLRAVDLNFLFMSSKILLCFNLLPIYPLDGGKLFFLLMTALFSFYHALKYTLYMSFFCYFILLFSSIIFLSSFFWIVLFFSLFFRLWEEQKKVLYLYQRFILERYLKVYHFKKRKLVSSVQLMKKGYTHFFLVNGDLISEKKYLKSYFSFS